MNTINLRTPIQQKKYFLDMFEQHAQYIRNNSDISVFHDVARFYSFFYRVSEHYSLFLNEYRFYMMTCSCQKRIDLHSVKVHEFVDKVKTETGDCSNAISTTLMLVETLLKDIDEFHEKQLLHKLSQLATASSCTTSASSSVYTSENSSLTSSLTSLEDCDLSQSPQLETISQDSELPPPPPHPFETHESNTPPPPPPSSPIPPPITQFLGISNTINHIKLVETERHFRKTVLDHYELLKLLFSLEFDGIFTHMAY